MSLEILKSGLLDIIQDGGRFGYQHLGINPTGAMDRVAMRVANLLVGNAPGEAVLEMHFPAATIRFNQRMLIALSGANFNALLDEITFPINKIAMVQPGTTLRFASHGQGARVYLAVQGGFEVDSWLNSQSTNLKVAAGGFNGRALRKGDVLNCRSIHNISIRETRIFCWTANTAAVYNPKNIRVIAGQGYNLLKTETQALLTASTFRVTEQSDRMGYRLHGPDLRLPKPAHLLSTGVAMGTVQLLPNGQLIVLMADHQTTGGYPQVAHVISADLPTLAQKSAGDTFQFELTDITTAGNLYLQQNLHLLQLKNACNFRLAAIQG